MLIYFVLIGVLTGLSMIVLPSSGSRTNSVSRGLFNYTDWTVIWTILFVYSIQVSAFSVVFGQFFKHRKREKRHSLVDFIIVCNCSITSKITWIYCMGNNIH
jgi:hypothetical protein